MLYGFHCNELIKCKREQERSLSADESLYMFTILRRAPLTTTKKKQMNALDNDLEAKQKMISADI